MSLSRLTSAATGIGAGAGFDGVVGLVRASAFAQGCGATGGERKSVEVSPYSNAWVAGDVLRLIPQGGTQPRSGGIVPDDNGSTMRPAMRKGCELGQLAVRWH